MPFNVKSKQSGDDLEFECSGVLEQGQSLPAVKPRLAHRIVLDLDKVERINSQGLQILTLWFRSFDKRQQFVFRKVPRTIVSAFNTIQDILPHDRIVESFYVPYVCTECDHEEAYLARRGKDFVESGKQHGLSLNLPPTLNCTACKNTMKIEVWESAYFRFLGQP